MIEFFKYASFYTTIYEIFKKDINEKLLFFLDGKENLNKEVLKYELKKKEYLTGLIKILNSMNISLDEHKFLELKDYRDKLSHDLLNVYINEFSFDYSKLEEIINIYKEFMIAWFLNIEKSINPDFKDITVDNIEKVNFPILELFLKYKESMVKEI
jgi:flagellin-specific chaperone FliS